MAAWAANRYPRESSVTPGTDRSSDRAHVTISARDDGVPSRADNASEHKGDVVILMKFSTASGTLEICHLIDVSITGQRPRDVM